MSVTYILVTCNAPLMHSQSTSERESEYEKDGTFQQVSFVSQGSPVQFETSFFTSLATSLRAATAHKHINYSRQLTKCMIVCIDEVEFFLTDVCPIQSIVYTYHGILKKFQSYGII